MPCRASLGAPPRAWPPLALGNSARPTRPAAPRRPPEEARTGRGEGRPGGGERGGRGPGGRTSLPRRRFRGPGRPEPLVGVGPLGHTPCRRLLHPTGGDPIPGSPREDLAFPPGLQPLAAQPARRSTLGRRGPRPSLASESRTRAVGADRALTFLLLTHLCLKGPLSHCRDFPNDPRPPGCKGATSGAAG